MLLITAATQASAQQETLPAYRFRLLGVYDESSGNPIDGAKVSDAVTGTSSVTSKEGMVTLFFLPDGGSLVRLQKLGYETQTLPVSITPSDTAPITLLMRHVVELPTVVTIDSAPHYISPALTAFDERKRKSGTGYFMDHALLRKEEDHQLSDILKAHAPSVKFMYSQGKMLLMPSARCIRGGPPQVYLDGIKISADPPAGGKSGDNTPFDLSQFQVSDLAGVEWYPDTDMVPIQYAHVGGRCGALFLWTRER